MQIDWTWQALADLAEIRHYIEKERPQAAQRVAAHLWTSVEYLAEFPHLGSPGLRPGTRQLVIRPYVISYRVREEHLEILSVWHGRRSKHLS